jgi:hypothetical protein
MPYLDGNLRPRSVLGEVAREPGEVVHGSGCVAWVTADAIAATLTQRLPAPAIRSDTPEVDVVEQIGQAQRLLYVANPTAQDQHVAIAFATPRHLLPAWGGSAMVARDAEVALDLAPYTIQVWEAQA